MSMRGAKSILPAVLAALALAGAAGARAESGTGRIGDWELIWRYSESEGYQNRFREIAGNEVVFPFSWRRMNGVEGPRLVFFDADGQEEDAVKLGSGEEAVASEDGSAWLAWAERPEDTDTHEFRYWQRGATEPDWEAVAPGRPILFAPDGSLFVLASQTPLRDQFQRLSLEGVGLLQVVGAGGEVRGELPIFPIFARMTGDERRIVFLHDEEVIALGRDGILDWQLPVGVDNLSFRDGVPQLATGRGIVVVCGTGPRGEASTGTALQPPRQGTILALDDEGRVKWSRRQREEDDLWFQISAAVSADGGTVVTVHAPPRFYEIQAWDGETGEPLWSQRVRRASGFRSLSVSPTGRVIAFALGDNHTTVTAWNREGTVIWDGSVPYASQSPTLAGDDLLVARNWIVKLGLEDPGE